MDVPPEQHYEHDQRPDVERDRLYAPASRLDTGAACTLLVIQRVDGWSIYGLDLPEQGVYVSDNSMVLLARTILARAQR